MNLKFEKIKPVIGMVHLKPLPGSPNYNKSTYDMNNIIQFAVEESKIYQSAGVDGIQIENYWDAPFLKGSDIGYETVAAISVIANEISRNVSIPFGINVHLNGGIPAMAIAAATGARWVRVFEYILAYISYTGLTEGIGGKLSRYRKALYVQEDVDLLCDIRVKHGSHYIVNDRTMNNLAVDAQGQGADAIIVTGFTTGEPPTKESILEVKKGIKIPIFIGSGVNESNIDELVPIVDGIIVGSSFKKDEKIENIVSYKDVKKFMKKIEIIRSVLHQ